MEYIEYLQTRGLLKPDVEKMDLEDLQGVSGLKGLRVGVNVSSNLELEERPSFTNLSQERIFQ